MKRFPKQLAKFQRPQRGRGFALFNRNANTGCRHSRNWNNPGPGVTARTPGLVAFGGGGSSPPHPNPLSRKAGGEGAEAAWSRMVRRLPVKEECVGSNPTAAAERIAGDPVLVREPLSEGGRRWFDSSPGNWLFPGVSVLVLKPLFEGGRRWFDSSSRNLCREGGRRMADGGRRRKRHSFRLPPSALRKRLACFNGEAAGF
jgi:hypothetical protein